MIFVLDDVGFGQMSCFGGLVETPVLDRFAANGLRYTNMHTTALCSPSRGAIVTGRNHHSLGAGDDRGDLDGLPGLQRHPALRQGHVSEMLLAHGYNTFLVGKWHLSPPEHETPAGPYDRWPLGRGFERFYGFLGGDTNQWYPDLVYDNHSVEQPAQPEDGYHLSSDLADRAIEFIQDAHVNAPTSRSTCTTAPVPDTPRTTSPTEWADRYKGRFDVGWDEYRDRRPPAPAGHGHHPGRDRAVGPRSRRAGVGHVGGRRAQAVLPDDGGLRRVLEHTDHQFGRVARRSSRRSASSTTRCSWSSPTTAPAPRAGRPARSTR